MHAWAEGPVGVEEETWEGMLASFCSSGQRQALLAFIICTSQHHVQKSPQKCKATKYYSRLTQQQCLSNGCSFC